MKKIFLFLIFLISFLTSFTQQNDFIVIKKKNNRTLKTYFPGTFISAVTNKGLSINGFITDIRNDSLFWRQEEKRLMAVDWGTVVDTVFFMNGVLYTDIIKFNNLNKNTWGGQSNFFQSAIPKLMLLGGTGFIVLESFNTLNRKESFNDHKKLSSMAIAAGVAAAGYLYPYITNRHNRAGRRYKVIYLRREDLKF